MCVICDNKYNERTKHLYIKYCNNITTIPNIQGLTCLRIDNCPNILTIPNIESLGELKIYNFLVSSITKINYNFPKLDRLHIKNCLNLYDVYIPSNRKEVKRYLQSLMSRKILNWYRKCKRNKVLWQIAEYYTSKKYSPENVLKFIDLED